MFSRIVGIPYLLASNIYICSIQLQITLPLGACMVFWITRSFRWLSQAASILQLLGRRAGTAESTLSYTVSQGVTCTAVCFWSRVAVTQAPSSSFSTCSLVPTGVAPHQSNISAVENATCFSKLQDKQKQYRQQAAAAWQHSLGGCMLVAVKHWCCNVSCTHAYCNHQCG